MNTCDRGDSPPCTSRKMAKQCKASSNGGLIDHSQSTTVQVDIMDPRQKNVSEASVIA